MPGFTIVGVIIALIGTILISPEIFFGHGGILTNTEKQAEQQYGDEHGRFGGNEHYEENKNRDIEEIFVNISY